MKKWLSMTLLIAVIFISLALSSLPLFSNIKYSISEGFTEGFISPSETKDVQRLLDTYNKNVEMYCSQAVTGNGSAVGGLKDASWTRDNAPTAKMIFQEQGITFTNMVQQVMSKIDPVDPATQTILNTVTGQMYTETQALLNGIVSLKITDDEVFMSIVNKNLTAPIIITKGSAVSSAQQINNYLNGAPVAPPSE